MELPHASAAAPELPELEIIEGCPIREPELQEEKPIAILPSNHFPLTKAARGLFMMLAPLKILFVHLFSVVELILDPVKKEWQLSPITPAQLASRLEAVGQLYKHAVIKQKAVLAPSICSEASAKLLLYTPEARHCLYPISIVVNSPVLVEGPDGIPHVLAAGYHHHDRGTLVTKGLAPKRVPLEKAVKALLEILEDFDFETPADQARALAMILTPALVWGGLLRKANVPLFLIEANHSQAGKGYLAARIAAIYGETLMPQAQRKGGVGSFDEDFGAGLLKGKPLIFFDNLRDTLDSPYIEAFLTAQDSVLVRTPYRAAVEVDKRKYVVIATSNGFRTTKDLENRLIRIYIKKRPTKFRFKRFKGLSGLAHVEKNQSFFLGCVFSVLEHWIHNGKRRSRETRHHFREWAQTLDWILVHGFEGHITARLMDSPYRPGSRVVAPAKDGGNSDSDSASHGSGSAVRDMIDKSGMTDDPSPSSSEDDPSQDEEEDSSWL